MNNNNNKGDIDYLEMATEDSKNSGS